MLEYYPPEMEGPTKSVLLASNNPHKAEEVRAIVGKAVRVVTPRDLGLQLEVPETGETFAENARIKAEAFAAASGMRAVSDDSGLVVDALGGEPGVRSARFGGPGLSDEDRLHLLLDRLRGVPSERRGAHFVTVIAVAEAGRQTEVVEGRIDGMIADRPRGNGGFGYDPVFLLPALGRTFGEMTRAEKSRISHRALALHAALPLLLA